MNVLTRGVRNAFRNVIRTFSIIVILGLSVGLALSMVVARGAVQQKINSVKSSIGNTITVAPAGVQGFEGGGNPLTTSQVNQIKGLSHVSSIAQTLSDRWDTSTTNLVSAIDPGTLGRRFRMNDGGGQVVFQKDGATAAPTSISIPVTVTGTDNPDASSAAKSGKLNLTSGSAFSATSSDDVAVVGKDLATKNNLKVGSTFTAYNTTIKVVGIYDSGNTFTNASVLMPLTTLQNLSSQQNDVTDATVTVDSITNVDSVVTAIKNKLGSAADVTSQQDSAQNALQPLENIKTVSLFSLIGAVVAGSVILLLTMIMIVRERRREIGVLKAIGASNIKVVFQFMAESVTLTMLSAVIGVLLGIIGGQPITKILVSNSTNSSPTLSGPGGGGFRAAGGLVNKIGFGGQSLRNIHAVVGWDILVYGLGAALLIAVIGSAVAALLIAKVRPAEVMRAE